MSDSIATKPPASWFDDPKLDGPTPLTVAPGGRIYGHAWTWGACHTGKPGRCVTAPHSASGYRFFHLGEVECLGKKTREVGQITLATGHAPPSAGAYEAIEHYDHTGAAVADVRMGEDEWGGWFAGALRPGLEEHRVRELRGAKLSGDWRTLDGQLDLIGILATNVPGFPVPRVRRSEHALVAAGMLDEPPLPRRTDIARNAKVRALVASAQAPAAIRELVRRARGSSSR